MKKLKKSLSRALLLSIGVLLMSSSPVPKGNFKESLDECIAPGQVGLLATVPQNCQSTVYAFSQFATGANWTVTGGILSSGQGTLSIVILPDSFFGSKVTVTCKTFNECGYSANTASRTYFVSCD